MITSHDAISTSLRRLENRGDFALLILVVALAATGQIKLAAYLGQPVPLLPGYPLALAGLLISAHRHWAAPSVGLAGAFLLASGSSYSLLSIVPRGAGCMVALWCSVKLIDCVAGACARAFTRRHYWSAAAASLIVSVTAITVNYWTTGLNRGIVWPLVMAGSGALLLIAALSWFRADMARGRWRALHIAALVVAALAAWSWGRAMMIPPIPAAWGALPVAIFGAFLTSPRDTALRTALLVAAILSAAMISALAGPPGATAGQAFLAAAVSISVAMWALDGLAFDRAALYADVEETIANDLTMRAFVDASPVAIAMFDAEFRHIAASARYVRDFAPGEIVAPTGRTVAAVSPSLDDRLQATLRAAMLGQESICHDVKVNIAGAEAFVDCAIRPWRDQSGAIGGGIVSIEITTERVLARASLEEAEGRYRALFEQSIMGFVRSDLNGTILEVNDVYCRITGRDRAALIGRCCRELLQPADVVNFEAELEAFVAGRGGRTWEHCLIRPDGSSVWAACASTLIVDRDGAPRYISSVIYDITARKQAEAALARSEIELQLAQRSAGVAFWEFDAGTQAITSSREMLSLHGCSPDHAGGVPLADWTRWIEGDVAPNYPVAGAEAALSGGWHDLVYAIRRPGAQRAWVRSVGLMVDGDDGQRSLIGMIIDVTAFKRAQAELQRAQSTMLRVSHLSAMGSVAATLAHELNQPLAATVNFLEIATQCLAADAASNRPRLEDAVEQARTQALRAGHIVQKMRAVTNPGRAARRSVNVTDLIESVIALIAPDDIMASVTLRCELDHGDARIHADRLQLEQVLTAILLYAADCSAAHGVKEVGVTSRVEGAAVCITLLVSVPTTDEYLASLFDVFRTPQSYTAGPGLPVCRTIIEDHGGQMVAQRLPKVGAEILIRLPLVEQIAPVAGARAEPESVAAPV